MMLAANGVKESVLQRGHNWRAHLCRLQKGHIVGHIIVVVRIEILDGTVLGFTNDAVTAAFAARIFGHCATGEL